MQERNGKYTIAHLSALMVMLSAMEVALMAETMAVNVSDTEPPVARFIGNVTILPAGQLAGFDATTSSDNIGIVLYEWNFGDKTVNISGNKNLASVVNHTFVSEGTYLVTLKVSDAAGNTNETGFSMIVAPPLIFADLYLSDLGFSNTKPVNGTVTKISMKLGNQGEKRAANFTVRFMDGTNKFQDVFVQSLEVGQTTTLTVNWTPSSAGGHRISISVDATSVIPESNETNNWAEVNQEVALDGTPETENPTGTEESGINQGLIIGALVIVIIVLAVLVALLMMRRKIQSPSDPASHSQRTHRKKPHRRHH